MEVLIGQSPLNGPFSSKSCLIAGGRREPKLELITFQGWSVDCVEIVSSTMGCWVFARLGSTSVLCLYSIFRQQKSEGNPDFPHTRIHSSRTYLNMLKFTVGMSFDLWLLLQSVRNWHDHQVPSPNHQPVTVNPSVFRCIQPNFCPWMIHWIMNPPQR